MHDLDRSENHPELSISSQSQSHAQRLRDWVDLFRDIYKVSEALSRTAFVPNGMQGKTEDIAACVMKGYELGMDPLDALASMYVVHGKVGVSAEFMRRRILQAGHTFKIIESTDSRAIVEATRKEGGEVHRATFTAEQARKAGIDICKYPADKLIARATSRLCRQSFPDVLSGSLLVEELEDSAQDEPGTPEPKPAIRRRHAAPKPVAANTQPKEIASKPSDEDVDDLLDDTPTDKTESTRVAVEQMFATKDQQTAIGKLFDQIEVSDRDARRNVVAAILGYQLDDASAMLTEEAETIIAKITGWMSSESYQDEVNDILNKAFLREVADQ